MPVAHFPNASATILLWKKKHWLLYLLLSIFVFTFWVAVSAQSPTTVHYVGSIQWSQKGRIARWIMDQQEFEFTVKHRAGNCNRNADALSRLNHDKPPEMCSADISCPDVSCLVSLNPDAKLVDAQYTDPDLSKIIELKTQGFPKPPSFVWKGNPSLQSFFSCQGQLYVNDGLLLRAVKAHCKLLRNVVMVPQLLVSLVIQNLHSSPSGGAYGHYSYP